METKNGKRRRKRGEKVLERVFFFARRRSQLSPSVISPSLNLFTHQVLRYHSSGASFQVVTWLFFLLCHCCQRHKEKLLQRDANCYILVQENERAVCFRSSRTTLSLFSVFLSLHSYHDSPPRCRPRGRHLPRAPCAGRPGEIWRKREQESTVVQARRERGG